MHKNVIIDTDGAADDVRAISLALQTESVKVLAITTVSGTVNIDQVITNVSRTLRANRNIVPVYKGAAEPLVSKTGRKQVETYFFGRDGLSDQPGEFPEVTPEDALYFVEDKPAAVALIELLKKHDDVTLVCIGPLTNVALAMLLEPEFKKLPKELIVMGGNIYGVGNVSATSTAEFNFSADPEAAHMVLSKMMVPITLIPWEVFFFHGKKHEKEVDFHFHLKYPTPLGRFLSMATSVCRKTLALSERQFSYCDEIAVASAINPLVITEYKYLKACVELGGTYTRGQVVCDWTDELLLSNAEVQSGESDDETLNRIKFVVAYDTHAVDKMIREAVKRSE